VRAEYQQFGALLAGDALDVQVGHAELQPPGCGDAGFPYVLRLRAEIRLTVLE
jgi:hypothetical protein